jgi:hypothetical protein
MSNTGTFKALGDLPDDIVSDFKNKEYKICKEKCTNFLVSNPDNGIAFIYLGKIAESEKDFETAIAHYKRVTEIEPRFPFIWSYIGENYTELERYKEAYEAFTEEIALMPSKAAPWCMASLSAQKMGDHELAVGILKMAQGKVEKELYDLDVAAGRRVGAPNISAKKGVLAWPMEGVVTQGYGNTGFTDLGYTFHNGIDIAAPAGQPIYAAADGIVDTCNSSNYAYGNWCSILHTVDSNNGPVQIVSLYGHMRSYVVSAGQVVKQGDLIGFEGNTGNTTRLLYGAASGFHVHFTIFARSGYTVTKGSYGDYLIPSGVTLNPFSFLGS